MTHRGATMTHRGATMTHRGATMTHRGATVTHRGAMDRAKTRDGVYSLINAHGMRLYVHGTMDTVNVLTKVESHLCGGFRGETAEGRRPSVPDTGGKRVEVWGPGAGLRRSSSTYWSLARAHTVVASPTLSTASRCCGTGGPSTRYHSVHREKPAPSLPGTYLGASMAHARRHRYGGVNVKDWKKIW